MTWNALILAGRRTAQDAVAVRAQVATKALAQIGDKSMLRRVYDTLESLPWLSRIRIIGNIHLLRRHKDFEQLPDSIWIEGEKSLPSSVAKGIDRLGLESPLLVTTGDSALLQRDWVDTFRNSSLASDADCTVGMVRLDKKANPSIACNRTSYRCTDGDYSSCNLFALMTPEALQAVNKWGEIQQHRKRPLRIVSAIGWWPLLKFAMGRSSLQDIFTGASRYTGCRVKPILIPDQLAAVDVDSLADWEMIQELIDKAGRRP